MMDLTDNTSLSTALEDTDRQRIAHTSKFDSDVNPQTVQPYDR